MKMEISVSEAMELINEIRQQPEGLFEMIRTNVKETVGQYLSGLMETELTAFLGRERYERVEGEDNHRNGSYGRNFTLKGVGAPYRFHGTERAPSGRRYFPAASNTKTSFVKICAPCFWPV